MKACPTAYLSFVLVAALVVSAGCGGEGALAPGGGGGGGAPTVSPARLDSADWQFKSDGSVGIAIAGLITLGAALGITVPNPTTASVSMQAPPGGRPFAVGNMNAIGQVIGNSHAQ